MTTARPFETPDTVPAGRIQVNEVALHNLPPIGANIADVLRDALGGGGQESLVDRLTCAARLARLR